MELFLHKYRVKRNEFLLYDCQENEYLLNKEEVRIMCSTNFGIDVKSMIVGPINEMNQFLYYSADGNQKEMGEEEKAIISQYLFETGKQKEKGDVPVNHVSRIYIFDHFIYDNHMKCLEKKAK